MTLTKTDIANEIRSKPRFTWEQSLETVEALLEIIKRTLASGEDVMVSGFGKFRVKHKRERRGRNPATDEALMLRRRRVVTFKSSEKLRDKVNRN